MQRQVSSSSDRMSQKEGTPTKPKLVSQDSLTSSHRGLLLANADQASSSSTLNLMDDSYYPLKTPNMKTIKEEEHTDDADQPNDTTIEGINHQIKATPTFKLTQQDPSSDSTVEPREHLERVHASYDVQCNQVVPIDRSEYIQTMFNPLTAGDNPELITVQVFNPRLREYSDELAKELKEKSLNGLKQSRCPEGKELTECLVIEKKDGIKKGSKR